jgi:hypothetical protein
MDASAFFRTQGLDAKLRLVDIITACGHRDRMLAHYQHGLDILLEGRKSRSSDLVAWTKMSLPVISKYRDAQPQLETVVKKSILIPQTQLRLGTVVDRQDVRTLPPA